MRRISSEYANGINKLLDVINVLWCVASVEIQIKIWCTTDMESEVYGFERTCRLFQFVSEKI